MKANELKTNAKVIAYLRTSTDSQEIASQQQVVEQWIKDDKYTNDQIIRVGHAGISACNPKSEYYQLYDLMEQYIREDNVKCIYVYSITRLVRMDESRLFDFINNWLIPKGVQLKVHENGLRLLDDNGTLNPSMELALKMMALMAKQQTAEMKAQLARGKAYLRAQGIRMGGKPTFGYKVNGKRQKCVIDEEQAAIVRRIYDMFINQHLSCQQIGKQLNDEGVFKHSCRISAARCMAQLMKNPHYLGDEFYPPIIDPETFAAASQLLQDKAIKPRQSYKGNVYYGQGLLKHGDLWLRVCKNTVRYALPCGHLPEDRRSESLGINLNTVDSLLMYAYSLLDHDGERSEQRERCKERIEGYERTITAKRHEIERNAAALERITDLYIDGALTKDKAAAKSEPYKVTNKRLEAEIKAIQMDIIKANEELERASDNGSVDIYSMEPKRAKDEIHRVFESAQISKIKRNRMELTLTPVPWLYRGESMTFIINSYSHQVWLQGLEFSEVMGEGDLVEVLKELTDFKVIERFKRVN